MDKNPPTPLFLAGLAGIGTALLSPLQVGGEPIIVLIIPIALIATYFYNAETGAIVGASSAVVSGLLLYSIAGWETIVYALAASLTVLIFEMVYEKKKKIPHLVFFAILGTLLFELLNDFQSGQNILLRSENFLGTSPGAGIRIAVNTLLTWLGISLWINEK